MITAVDSNVILDVLLAQRFGVPSKQMLRACRLEGSLIACDVVFAEASAWAPSPQAARDSFNDLGIVFDSIDQKVAVSAGTQWRAYRRRGGARDRILPDFLVGAHAAHRADRLLTRDRGFYRTYFKGLRVLDPTKSTET